MIDCSGGTDKQDLLTPYLMSTLIFPIFFTWGILFFVAVLLFWCEGLATTCSLSKAAGAAAAKKEKQKNKDNPRQRTLSDDISGDFVDT